MERKVSVIEDLEGKKIVVIHDICFKGRQSINWDEVEEYLKQFVGRAYQIENTGDLIYIGPDLPDEYGHSEYTISLKGASAKAKANATQGIPEILKISIDKKYRRNVKKKHNKDAKYGWYRYTARFALPVFNEGGEVERYNVFQGVIIARCAEDGKMYLYDIMNIKKETSNLFQS